jgi:hypothetical protein
MNAIWRQRLPLDDIGTSAYVLETGSDMEAVFYPNREVGETPDLVQAGPSLVLGWGGEQYLRFDMFSLVEGGNIMWHLHRNPLPDAADTPIRLNELGPGVIVHQDTMDALDQFFLMPDLLRKQVRLACEQADEDDRGAALKDVDLRGIARQMERLMMAMTDRV